MAGTGGGRRNLRRFREYSSTPLKATPDTFAHLGKKDTMTIIHFLGAGGKRVTG
jgi:hypothetical protein